MKQKRRWISMVLLFAFLFCSFCIFKYIQKGSKKQPSIGVTMWNAPAELYTAIDTYAQKLESSLDFNLQILKCRTSGYIDYEEMIDQFASSGGKVLINIITEDILEILQFCEKNEVYLLQMWEMPQDTDVLDRLNNSPYFLGYMISDEKKACHDMAKAIQDSGSKHTAVIIQSTDNINCNVHFLRCSEFENGLGREHIATVLKIAWFSEGIKYLKNMDIPIDSILSSMGMSYAPLSQIKSDLGNPSIKFACFDTDSHTKTDLENGDLVMVSCGQQHVFILASVYAYAFTHNQVNRQEKVEIICPYLEITSLEEYELYQEMCVQNIPYSAEELIFLTNHIKNNNNMLTQYANSFNIEWLIKQKNS